MRTLLNSADSIGAALAQAVPFDRIYSAENIEAAVQEDLDVVVATAVAPLAWATNQASTQDLYSIRRLQEIMATCRISHLVLISSVSVYPLPVKVDEESPIKATLLGPYGRHRHELERWCQARFDTTVIRLPHVFGGPYRSDTRNPPRDLARFAALNPESTKQHYDLARLADDLRIVHREGLRLVNLVPPPVTNREVLCDLLGVSLLPGASEVQCVHRDVHTRYAELFGGVGRYIETTEQELQRIAAYIADTTPAPAPEMEGG